MAATQDLIVLDRDGVINEDSEEYIKGPDEWRPIAGSLAAIGKLTRAGFRIVIVSNQSGLGRGLFTLDDLDAINRKMSAAIAAAGGSLAGIYHCPHLPDDGCDCRKPATGLLDRAAEDLGADFSKAPLIGDKASDVELADRVGARPILVRTGYGRQTAATLAASAAEVYDDLAAAADALIAERNT
ncbi:MAG TPA: D-glycero-beta-D-manno-heptose 1,7-bisphosphate 7-phosphatase [Gammaproteobacteria bacterium]